MKNKIQLSEEQTKYLSELPEQGMGYQIVDVFLKNGEVLKQRVVLNATFLTLEENEDILLSDILKIKLAQ